MFDRHEACRAFSRALAKTGNKIAARIAIIAITTSNSMRVKPRRMTIYLLSVDAHTRPLQRS